jgi:hypothetical protein
MTRGFMNDRPDLTNEDRAVRAVPALKQYMDADFDEPTNITDLLADLMHYAAHQDIDFDRCLETAEIHFHAEKDDEEY